MTGLKTNDNINTYDIIIFSAHHQKASRVRIIMILILMTTFTMLSSRQSMREYNVSVRYAGFQELDVANLLTAKRNSLGNSLLMVSTGRCRRQRRHRINGDGS